MPTPAASETPAKVLDDRGCVIDAKGHAVQFILAEYSEPIAQRLGRDPVASDLTGPHGVFIESMPDVDGDATQETVVSEGYSWGVHASLHVLYFSNNGCRKLAGGIVNGPLNPLPSETAGILDLEATWSHGCAGNDYEWTQVSVGRQRLSVYRQGYVPSLQREREGQSCSWGSEHAQALPR
jgi:hypothetical protein